MAAQPYCCSAASQSNLCRYHHWKRSVVPNAVLAHKRTLLSDTLQALATCAGKLGKRLQSLARLSKGAQHDPHTTASLVTSNPQGSFLSGLRRLASWRERAARHAGTCLRQCLSPDWSPRALPRPPGRPSTAIAPWLQQCSTALHALGLSQVQAHYIICILMAGPSRTASPPIRGKGVANDESYSVLPSPTKPSTMPNIPDVQSSLSHMIDQAGDLRGLKCARHLVCQAEAEVGQQRAQRDGQRGLRQRLADAVAGAVREGDVALGAVCPP